MSTVALALVLLTGIGWSGLDVLRKRLTRDLDPLRLVFYLTAGQVPVFAIWAAIARPAVAATAYAPVGGLAILLGVVANIAYVEALRTGELSRTVPLLSLTPAVTALLAIPILGEVPGGRDVAGIALVVVGAWILSTRRGVPFGGRAAALMLVVVLSWSGALPVDKLGMELAGPSGHGLLLSLGMTAALGAILAARGRVRELLQVPGRARVPLAGAVLVSAAALGAQLLALGLVSAALVETVKRAVGNLLALAWGRSVFREPVTPRKTIALVLLAFGAGLVLS